MILSSDKLSGLRKPSLLLKLDLTAPDSSVSEKLIELSVTELEELLTKLRAAQAVRTVSFCISLSSISIDGSYILSRLFSAHSTNRESMLDNSTKYYNRVSQ